MACADEKFPKSHKFTIGDRIEMIALDVLEALIEATYTKERTLHLRRANLGIEKLRASCFDSQPTSDCWIDAGTSTRRVHLTIPDAWSAVGFEGTRSIGEAAGEKNSSTP